MATCPNPPVNHDSMFTARESNSSLDDILKNALELYKVKNPKQQSFIFLHCWLLLRDVPRWIESVPNTRQRLAVGCICRRHRSARLPLQTRTETKIAGVCLQAICSKTQEPSRKDRVPPPHLPSPQVQAPGGT